MEDNVKLKSLGNFIIMKAFLSLLKIPRAPARNHHSLKPDEAVFETRQIEVFCAVGSSR